MWCFLSERAADNTLPCLDVNYHGMSYAIGISLQVWGIGAFILTKVSPQPSYRKTKFGSTLSFMHY